MLVSWSGQLSAVDAAPSSRGSARQAELMDCSITHPTTHLLAFTYRYTCTTMQQ